MRFYHIFSTFVVRRPTRVGAWCDGRSAYCARLRWVDMTSLYVLRLPHLCSSLSHHANIVWLHFSTLSLSMCPVHRHFFKSIISSISFSLVFPRVSSFLIRSSLLVPTILLSIALWHVVNLLLCRVVKANFSHPYVREGIMHSHMEYFSFYFH